LVRTNNPTASDRIFSALNLVFPYQPASYIGASSLNLATFVQWTQNKAVV